MHYFENIFCAALESVFSLSVFRKPGVSGHGLYEVKKDCLKEFNPFFYHYSRSQHSKVFQCEIKRILYGVAVG